MSEPKQNCASMNNAECKPSLRDTALCAAIEQALLSFPMPTTEHAFLKYAEQQGALDEVLTSIGLDHVSCSASACKSAMLNLFYRHFLVRHCLYLLRREYLQQDLGFISISPVKIELFSVLSDATDGSRNIAQGIEQPGPALEAYYLDLSNLNKESDASITDMLAGFWQKYASRKPPCDAELKSALAQLDLSLPLAMAQLRTRYRSKVQAAHPDRGGSHEAFLELQHAYETLRRYVNSQT